MADLRFFVTEEGTLNRGGSGNDTIFTFTGTQSATTVKGVDGNDLISFANQTTAVTVGTVLTTTVHSAGMGALSAGAGSAGLLNATFSGVRESAGTIASGRYTAGQVSLSAGQSVSGDVQKLVSTALQNANSILIQGGKGNDSIYLGDQIAAFNNNKIKAGDGNDILGTFNSGGRTTATLGQFSGGAFKGGDGQDTIFVGVSATSAKGFRLNGGSGNDSVRFSGATEVNNALIGGGAGNDSIAFVANSGLSTTINGGNGDDSIDLLVATVTTKGLIQGDSSTVTGSDTIRLDLGIASSTTIDGGLGADSIVLSGKNIDGGSNQFLGGAGNDTIYFQSAGARQVSASTIAGGAGNDSIRFEAQSAAAFTSGYIKGGGGDDTITITEVADGTGSAGFAGGSIKGGGGADSITLSAVETGGAATFMYTKYSESTLSSTDTLTFNTAAVSAGSLTFASASIFVNVAAGLNTGVSAQGVDGTVSASGGFVVFSGFSDNNLTARVSAIDAGYTTTGDFAIFTTDATKRYLFVQGGATDLVVRLADDNQLSAGQGTLVRSGNTLALGGN